MAMANKCGNCRKLNTNELRCSKCHLVYFCNDTCITNGWNEHKKICKFIRETNPSNLISVARQRIATAMEENKAVDIIMYEPLLQMIIQGQNDHYKQSQYGIFGRAFHKMIWGILNTQTDRHSNQLNKLRHHLIEISQELAKLYGQHNELMNQGLMLTEIGHLWNAMNMQREAKSYYEQVGKLAEENALINLESLADTGLGNICLFENKIQEGLHFFRMGVSAAIHDANFGGKWLLVVNSVSPLLEALFKFTENKDDAREVEDLIEEYKKAKNEIKSNNQSTIIIELRELLFTVRLYEVSPIHPQDIYTHEL